MDYYKNNAKEIIDDYENLIAQIKKEYHAMLFDNRPSWMTNDWILECLSSVYGLDEDMIKKIICF